MHPETAYLNENAYPVSKSLNWYFYPSNAQGNMRGTFYFDITLIK